MAATNFKWFDRKRSMFFGLPLSFTKYMLTDDKLIVKSGVLSTKEEEIRLYRIMDVTLKRTLGERLFGLGTIQVISSDKSTPELLIKRVKKPSEVKDLLSDTVEVSRRKNRVSSREFMANDATIDDDFDDSPF